MRQTHRGVGCPTPGAASSGHHHVDFAAATVRSRPAAIDDRGGASPPHLDLATPALSAYDPLEIATLNGAKATGFAEEVGALVPGMKGDANSRRSRPGARDPWIDPEFDIAHAALAPEGVAILQDYENLNGWLARIDPSYNH